LRIPKLALFLSRRFIAQSKLINSRDDIGDLLG
jgi:hypothetical protein